MKRLAVFLLVLLMAPLAWTQQSSEGKSEWPICFGESSWAAFEAEIQAVQEQTAREAVEEAVKPHLEYETKLQQEIGTITRARDGWKWVAIGGIGATAACVLLMLVQAFK